MTGTATVTVSAPTVDQPANVTYCNGEMTAAIHFTGTDASAYSWTNDLPGIGLAASGTGDIASFHAVNNTSAPVTAHITVTPSAGSFPVTTSFFYTGSIVNWTVPAGVTSITVKALGAKGGGDGGGGKGAAITGTFTVAPGNILGILAGQMGGKGGIRNGSGGGGSFLWNTSNSNALLMAAAGGGGQEGFNG